MKSRSSFLKASGAFAAGSLLLPDIAKATSRRSVKDVGLQLYTVRSDMLKDNIGTLKKIAATGYKEIESAGSDKGSYYGLAPAEMKKICRDLGMTFRSGHLHYDQKWEQTIDDAVESGQEYMIICASHQWSDNRQL